MPPDGLCSYPFCRAAWEVPPAPGLWLDPAAPGWIPRAPAQPATECPVAGSHLGYDVAGPYLAGCLQSSKLSPATRHTARGHWEPRPSLSCQSDTGGCDSRFLVPFLLKKQEMQGTWWPGRDTWGEGSAQAASGALGLPPTLAGLLAAAPGFPVCLAFSCGDACPRVP